MREREREGEREGDRESCNYNKIIKIGNILCYFVPDLSF